VPFCSAFRLLLAKENKYKQNTLKRSLQRRASAGLEKKPGIFKMPGFLFERSFSLNALGLFEN